ncbi:hypothetical protein JMN10_15075 [Capnocytophaga genosp. AHN8471]|uniref:Uncharacterized protein n=1 Tax=Capnocytophaga genosp. AHN8471 TaxID=327574 RepID=A0ABS1Z046_9FLAO|nr:hypothetical protein [Capnocytophaga genosp. AHN8471]MBM0652042.1 hypothetical protein [Capnocytophaga genosp. AHN8471]MBM0663483.1 hypothetical protein [Capnocytophaga genosp. AHN8471]
MFEKFDFELDKNNYKGYVRATIEELPVLGGYFKLSDGGFFLPHNGRTEIDYIVIPPPPAFYSQRYYYHQNGKLESKGKYFGLRSFVSIGLWQYYDENGKLIKEVNEDAKFRFWTSDKILEILHNEGLINLRTGENRSADKFSAYFIEKEKKLVFNIFHKEIDFKSESYWEFVFDCKIGNYSKKKYNRYKYGVQILEKPLLKGSKEYEQKYKKDVSYTFHGKTYTEEEWKAFEQEQWEKYQAKRNHKSFWDKLFG